jgi:hypothetical protein
MGLLSRLLDELEPGDVVGIEAYYNVEAPEGYTERYGMLYTTVLQRTLEELVFTVLVQEITNSRIEGLTRYPLASRMLSLRHTKELSSIELQPHKPVMVFKGIRQDLSDAHLVLLTPVSESKN